MSCLTGPAGADPWDQKGITIMTNLQHMVGGVDSHKDTIHVAVITEFGQRWTDKEFTRDCRLPTSGCVADRGAGQSRR